MVIVVSEDFEVGGWNVNCLDFGTAGVGSSCCPSFYFSSSSLSPYFPIFSFLFPLCLLSFINATFHHTSSSFLPISPVFLSHVLPFPFPFPSFPSSVYLFITHLFSFFLPIFSSCLRLLTFSILLFSSHIPPLSMPLHLSILYQSPPPY